MMKLSLMRDFLEAEETETLIDTLLVQWGYDKETVHFIRASNNFVFQISQAEKHAILRLTDTEKVTHSELESELNFLKYLHNNGLCVNLPLPSLTGQEIEVCHTPAGSLYAVVFNYFAGTIYDIDELEERQFALWGEALGTLHQLSARSFGIQRTSYLQRLDQSKKLLKEQEQLAHAELLTLTHWLSTVPKTQNNYGLIHFDFELDNLIWNGDKIQMIDFDSSIEGWYVADIAFALRDLFQHEVDLSHKAFLSFIEGYRKKMDVSQQELNAIPMFLRLQNLEVFIRLQTIMDIGQSPSQNNPQWALNLLAKLEGKVNDYRTSLQQYHHEAELN
jgi:Ser/Thr protein kinase RdoA (MazF antagonist)